MPTLGVDLLGSDAPPHELLDTVLLFIKENPNLADFVVFGRPEDFSRLQSSKFLQFVETEEFIHMEESPLKAIRAKKRASMVLGIQQLAKKKLDAFISCGNTGALLAASKLFLDPLPSISRPALLATLPTQEGSVAVIDVGASINPSADLLLDFARIGCAYQKCAGIKKPRVALLNIGSEAIKGTDVLREAHAKLLGLRKNAEFIGNVEAREVFKGIADVVVADGFSGNVLLKTAEGVGEMVLQELSKVSSSQVIAKLSEKFSYSKYPGALLCGMEGLVMKCHGTAHPVALISSLYRAIELCEQKFLTCLKKHLIN